MKFFKFIIAPILFVVLFQLPVSAQNDLTVLNKIIAKTAKIYNDYPVEKVYLHFDKPYYAVGDTMWFKAYLTVDKHVLSTLSKIIYVDIFAPHDSLVQSLKLPVKNGVSAANVALIGANYHKANYRVVAYTNWMNNSDPGYFFNKSIPVGNAIDNDLSTQVSLKSTGTDKQEKITAGVFYKDGEGKPYAGKKVSWTAQKGYDVIEKGRETTDANGFVTISFVNAKSYGLDSVSLVTAIDIDNRKLLNSAFPLKSIAKNVDFQFFPEGGELLYGVSNKVAFKAVKADGLGIDVKGTVTDNDNKVVAEFSSAHNGMGVFTLDATEGKTYKVKVTYANGTTATPDLPRIRTIGISIAADNTDPENLKIKLQATPASFQTNQGKTFFIVAKACGAICFAAQTQLTAQVYNASIPKSKFPTGILQLTLFNASGEPLSERIVFIQHNDQLNMAITSDRATYVTRQKVKLTVAAKKTGQPAEGNFSIAVIDESKVPVEEVAEQTILTSLLLTSEIKGYIEKPNYYFTKPTEKTAADLDILMQTQGYRRYSYRNIMNDKYPAIAYLPEQGIQITGTLRGNNGIPIKGGNVRLQIDAKNFSQTVLTDPEGRFVFSDLVFPDSSKVSVSARNNVKANDLVLTGDPEPAQAIPPNMNIPDEVLNIDSALTPYLENSKIQYSNKHILKEVIIKDKRKAPIPTHKDFGSLATLNSEADHLISGEQFASCGSFLECLKGLAMGMLFDQEHFYVLRHFRDNPRLPVQIFVRGSPVEASFLTTINPMDVASVEIFLKDDLGVISRQYRNDGIIVINMKKVDPVKKMSVDEIQALIPKRNEATFMPKGYAPVKTFYSPKYDMPRSAQNAQTDTRSTIYWNPEVITDKTGTTTLEYYNADGRGTYRAIVEGIDKDGNIGRQVYRYIVK